MFTLFVYSCFKLCIFSWPNNTGGLSTWISELMSWLQGKNSRDAFAFAWRILNRNNRVTCCVNHLGRWIFNNFAKVFFCIYNYLKDSSFVSRFQLQWGIIALPVWDCACTILKRVQCAFVALHKASFPKSVLHWKKQISQGNNNEGSSIMWLVE